MCERPDYNDALCISDEHGIMHIIMHNDEASANLSVIVEIANDVCQPLHLTLRVYQRCNSIFHNIDLLLEVCVCSSVVSSVIT